MRKHSFFPFSLDLSCVTANTMSGVLVILLQIGVSVRGSFLSVVFFDTFNL